MGLSLSVNSPVALPALVVLIMTARHPSATTIQKLKNKGLLHAGLANYTAHLGPHREVMGRESESRPRGAAFIGVKGGAQGYVGSLFSGELKTQEQEFKALEGLLFLLGVVWKDKV